MKSAMRNSVNTIQQTPLNSRLKRVRYMINRSSGIIVFFMVSEGVSLMQIY